MLKICQNQVSDELRYHDMEQSISKDSFLVSRLQASIYLNVSFFYGKYLD